MDTDMTPPSSQVILGIDLGTSGLRATIVERMNSKETSEAFPNTQLDRIVAEAKVAIKDQQSQTKKLLRQSDLEIDKPSACIQDPHVWIEGLEKLLDKTAELYPLYKVEKIIADATSSTLMLCNAKGKLLSNALMYNDGLAQAEAELIADFQKKWSQQNGAIQTAASGVSSSLAKALYLYRHLQQTAQAGDQKLQIVHQIDWLNNVFLGFLSQGRCYSDENNLLKLGYDPARGSYPEWLVAFLEQESPGLSLPAVGIPGTAIGPVSTTAAQSFGFSPECQVLYGTTDSIAGFFASGAEKIGDAVASLGSTLAIKQLSANAVFSSRHGLYSHKVHNSWLVGGASNSGGKVLLHFYSLDQIKVLDAITQALWQFAQNKHACLPAQLHTLLGRVNDLGDYYPLITPGERFPVSDSDYPARLAPEPEKPINTEMLTQLQKLQTEDFSDCNRFSLALEAKFTHQQINILCEHIAFFCSIIQGLTRVEIQAFELMQKLGVQGTGLYAVGGGTYNGYWQILRRSYLKNFQNPLQSPFSLEASYGVTRLARRKTISNDK